MELLLGELLEKLENHGKVPLSTMERSRLFRELRDPHTMIPARETCLPISANRTGGSVELLGVVKEVLELLGRGPPFSRVAFQN